MCTKDAFISGSLLYAGPLQRGSAEFCRQTSCSNLKFIRSTKFCSAMFSAFIQPDLFNGTEGYHHLQNFLNVFRALQFLRQIALHATIATSISSSS